MLEKEGLEPLGNRGMRCRQGWDARRGWIRRRIGKSWGTWKRWSRRYGTTGGILRGKRRGESRGWLKGHSKQALVTRVIAVQATAAAAAAAAAAARTAKQSCDNGEPVRAGRLNVGSIRGKGWVARKG